MRKILTFTALALPCVALALDYSTSSSQYTDAPFPVPEAAGISLLTNLGAVEGNPDGTFAPNRTLNRAEFLKIVLASSPSVRVSTSDAASCFPDVQSTDWFSRYVCLAKNRGIVAGYPDGEFKPANAVNYAEALKMLGELYEYSFTENINEQWYQKYARAAADRGVALPVNLAFDASLTRGQMARLAASYRAENDGELDLYRATERGETVSSSSASSSSSSSSESSSSSSESSSSVSSSSSSSSSSVDLVSVRSYLLFGERSDSVGDAHFTLPDTQTYQLRRVEVTLLEEVEGLEALYLIDEEGRDLATLIPDLNDRYDKKWYAEVTSGALLSGMNPKHFAIEARIYPTSSGRGTSGELFKMTNFQLYLQSITTSQVVNLGYAQDNFPYHTLSLSRITAVRNEGAETGTLSEGNDQKIGRFTFEADQSTGAHVRLIHVTFLVERTGAVDVSGWELGFADGTQKIPCYPEGSSIIHCYSIPESMGIVSTAPRTAELYGDVTVNGTGVVQAQIVTRRGNDNGGDIRWSDGTFEFTRVEKGDATIEGTRWSN